MLFAKSIESREPDTYHTNVFSCTQLAENVSVVAITRYSMGLDFTDCVKYGKFCVWGGFKIWDR